MNDLLWCCATLTDRNTHEPTGCLFEPPDYSRARGQRGKDRITVLPDRRYRWHVHPTTVRQAVSDAALSAGIQKRVTCHTLKHSFATYLLESGTDIRTIQQLLGRKGVSATMIYTHVVQRGAFGARSPLDA